MNKEQNILESKFEININNYTEIENKINNEIIQKFNFNKNQIILIKFNLIHIITYLFKANSYPKFYITINEIPDYNIMVSVAQEDNAKSLSKIMTLNNIFSNLLDAQNNIYNILLDFLVFDEIAILFNDIRLNIDSIEQEVDLEFGDQKEKELFNGIEYSFTLYNTSMLQISDNIDLINLKKYDFYCYFNLQYYIKDKCIKFPQFNDFMKNIEIYKTLNLDYSNINKQNLEEVTKFKNEILQKNPTINLKEINKP